MVATAKGRGFAGLEAMVSDIGAPKAPNAAGMGAAPPTLGAKPQATDQIGVEDPRGSSGGRGGVIFVILAVVALIVLILIANSGNQSSSRPKYGSTQTYVPPPPPPPPAPTYKPSPPPSYIPQPTYKPPSYVPPPKYDSNVESKPPVGFGQTLDRDQIRYCQSQKIRVSAWQSALNRYSSTAINAFNGAVDDYNARCSNYRYYSGVLEGVRADVEARRYTLEAEGRALAAANP